MLRRVGAPRPASRLLVPALCFIVMIIGVMQTAVVPILGVIGTQLGASTAAVGWILTANLLAAAVTAPVLGRLADLRGQRQVLLWVLAAALLGSLVCALAPSLPLLVVGRILQGLSYSLFPIALSIARQELEPRRLSGAIGYFSGTVAGGSTLSMVATGVLVSGGADYRGMFWLLAAVNTAALLLAAAFVPARPGLGAGRIDWVGALLLAAGTAAVLLALAEGSHWPGPATVACAVGGLAVLAAWFSFERGTPEPLVAPRMLMHRPVLMANVAAFLVGMAAFISFLTVTLFVQNPPHRGGYGFGASVLEAVVVYILPGALAGLGAAAVSGRLMAAVHPRHILAWSCLLGAAGFALFLAAHEEPWQVVTAVVLMNVFINVAYATLPTLLVAAVDPQDTGVAGGVNAIARTIGNAVGSALVASVLAGMLIAGTSVVQEQAYAVLLVVGGSVAVLTAVLGFLASSGRGPGPASRPGQI